MVEANESAQITSMLVDSTLFYKHYRYVITYRYSIITVDRPRQSTKQKIK